MRRKITRPKQQTYAQQLQERKSREMSKATFDGFNLGTMMMVVSINNVFGFGKKRFKQIEDEMNRIWADEFQKDVEVASVGLTKRCIQILGDDFEHYSL